MASSKTSNRSASPSKRAQLQAQQQAAALRLRRRRLTIVVIAAVVIIAIITTAIVWQVHQVRANDSQGGATITPSSSTGTFIPPHGASNMGYLEFKSDSVKPDAIVIDEHSDFQCPICQIVLSRYDDSLEELVDSGDIILHYHLRSFLDYVSANDSSTLAATAATCADTVDHFTTYHDVVFDNQPEEGTGFTDQQLRVDFAAKAGITGQNLTDFQACYDQQQTTPFVQAMEELNSTSTTINGAEQDPPSGTPAFYANGQAFTANDLITASEVTDAAGDKQTVYSATYPDAASLLSYLQDLAG
ncbi:MAG: DsbA family protein [Propionibacteriaceae bacterium]|nr:DsbA family protein [Propionibacteriaceae bacterium]